MVKLIALVIACAGLSVPVAQDKPAHDLDVPYVPTPMNVVDAMLRMAQVTPNDVVYDLGCGDGRIVIMAAQKYGAHGVGIDLDPRRIAEANENAKLARVTDRVKFVVQDVFDTDFSDATVVTLYMLPSENGTSKLIINKQIGQSGVDYDEKQDIGRVDLKRDELTQTVDRLILAMPMNKGGGGGTLQIAWEKTMFSIPFSVKK